MYVILQNPSRYKTGSKDQIIDPPPPPTLPLLINNDIRRMCAGYRQCPWSIGWPTSRISSQNGCIIVVSSDTELSHTAMATYGRFTPEFSITYRSRGTNGRLLIVKDGDILLLTRCHRHRPTTMAEEVFVGTWWVGFAYYITVSDI